MTQRNKRKVLIIGPVPPPAGGVSIHITRLAHVLSQAYQVKLVDESRVQKEGILNIRKFNPATYIRTLFHSNIVHIHSGPRMLKYAHIIFSRLLGKKVILTIHSYREKAAFPFSKLDSWVYSLPHVTIMVTSDFSKRLRLSNRVLVKDAFLPPVEGKEHSLPADMQAWISYKKQAGYTIACANAWRLDMHAGQDLYGLDLCIEAATAFKRSGRKIGFVFVVCDLGGQIDIGKYEEVIARNQLEDVFYLHKSQISFINLMKESHIVLRPTNTDGDALTIREALYLGKNVIASDVVQRPAGTVLFRNRETASLMEAMAETVDAANQQNGSFDKGQPDLTSFYTEIYSNLN